VSARRAAALARRAAERQGIDVTTGEIKCPPELRHPCYVEDWLTPADALLKEEDAWIVAWGRWKRARAAYAEERGRPVHELCGHGGRPRWRRDG
jgi:hypothetical protein